MTLPKINDVSKYEINIPSTKQKVRFRPYLVKGEKVLLIALESQDDKMMGNAVLDLVIACLEGDIDKRTLTTYDVEYLFTQIRGKSVGEFSTLSFYCQEENCDHENEVKINLSDIKIPDTQSLIKFQLTDEIGIEQKHPSYYDIINSDVLESETEIETLYKLVVKSIIAVTTEDERLLIKDEPPEEVYNFVNNLTSQQFESLRSYVDSAPTIKLGVDYKCKKCDNENHIELVGMRDFF